MKGCKRGEGGILCVAGCCAEVASSRIKTLRALSLPNNLRSLLPRFPARAQRPPPPASVPAQPAGPARIGPFRALSFFALSSYIRPHCPLTPPTPPSPPLLLSCSAPTAGHKRENHLLQGFSLFPAAVLQHDLPSPRSSPRIFCQEERRSDTLEPPPVLSPTPGLEQLAAPEFHSRNLE